MKHYPTKDSLSEGFTNYTLIRNTNFGHYYIINKLFEINKILEQSIGDLLSNPFHAIIDKTSHVFDVN